MSAKKPLRYFIELGGQSYEVRELQGKEAVSTPFRIEAGFVAGTAFPPDPDELIKSEAVIVLRRDEEIVRQIHGIVTEISASATIKGVSDLHVVIEPRLSLARHRTDLRVFRNMTVPEMVVDVLSQIGVAPELRLSGSYERRPYCVQFRESDLDYVHRLMEDEGIFYFFLEGDIMVLGDNPSAYEPMPGNRALPCRFGAGMDVNDDAVCEIGARAALTVGKVTLRDFNPEHPSLNMDVEAAGPTPAGPEFYDYPGEYLDPGPGQHKAKLISEAFACAAAAEVGRTFCGRFAPGFTFVLQEAPIGVKEGEYALLSVEHKYARAEDGFTLGFEALDAEITYRPPRVTYVPRILNPVTGFVTGPAGQDDIYTDEYGRVKIHFHWDRRLPPDEDCSHWIPTIQDNTGQSSAIPRRGWEMMVHFMEGDPDRPVILGRVYNAEDKFPVPLPARKSCTSLKSLSTPTRDGTNEIQIDDLAGKEYIQIHAERDENIVVANNKTENILINENSLVRHNETIVIGANHVMSAGRNIAPVINGNQDWSTGGNRTRNTTGADSSNVLGDRSVTIGGNHILLVADSSSTTATLLKEKIGGVVLEVFGKPNATESGKSTKRSIGGAVIELAEETKGETATKKRVELIGGVLFQKAKGEMKTKGGKLRKTTVAGAMIVRSKKQLSLTAAEKIKILSLTGSHKGDNDVTFKVKDTTIVIKSGVMRIYAPKTIALKISGSNQMGADLSFQN